MSSSPAAATFSSRCSIEFVPGIGTIAGERCSSHASAICAAVAPWALATRLPRARGLGHPTRREGIPRNVRKPVALAPVDERVVVPLGDAVAVLDRDDRHDLPRPIELPLADVREPDVPHLPLGTQLRQRAHGLLERHVRVYAVELVDVDPVEAEATQATLARPAQMLRPTIRMPAAVTRPGQPALRRDHHALGIGMQRLGDQPLAHLRTVRLRRVDEVDAQLDRPSQYGIRGLPVRGLSEDPRARDPHRPVCHAANLEIAAQGQRPGCGGGLLRGLGHTRLLPVAAGEPNRVR